MVDKLKSNTSLRLQEIMTERNLKQKDILDLATPYCKQYNVKLTKTDLSQYISGKVEPGQYKLMMLAYALHLNPTWLMGYDVPKEYGSATICDHSYADDHILGAISVLAHQSGFELSKFANSYQIEYNDTLVKLSPTQIDDYKKQVIEQIAFVSKCIFTNKLRANISPLDKDYFSHNTTYESDVSTLVAAHNDHITDINELEKTKADIANLKRPN